MVDLGRRNVPRLTLSAALLLTLLLWVARAWLPLPEAPLHVEGEVLSLKPSLGGGLSVRLRAAEGTRTVLASPNLGTLPPLAPGDWLTVQGSPRRWRGREFILPLSRQHLLVQAPQAISLQEAIHLPEGRPVTLQARAEGVEPYASRAGKTHLRFTLVQDEVRCPAIMWQDSFTSADQQRLASGQLVNLRATTARYRQQPSLVVHRLAP